MKRFTFIILTAVFIINTSNGWGRHHFQENIIVIGDSISDLGNAPPEEVTFIPPLKVVGQPPLTDGVTYTYILARNLGIPNLTPSTQGGSNQAYVSAETELNIVVNTQTILSMRNQVNQISPQLSRSYPVIVFGGVNDIANVLFNKSPPPIPSPQQVATNIVEVVKEVKRRGFKTIFVSNLPDLGRPPAVKIAAPIIGITPEELTAISMNTNQSLKTLLADLSINVIEVDIFSLNEEVLNHPEIYLLEDTFPDPRANLSGLAFFYDGFHPSEALHTIIADYYCSLFSAPVSYGTLAQVPFSFFRQISPSVQQQLPPFQPSHKCLSIYPFLSGNYAPLLKKEIFTGGDMNTHGGDVVLGLTQRLTSFFTWGLAGSYARDHSDRDRACKDFSFNTNTWSALLSSSFHFCRGYVNTIFSANWLDFTDIKRSFILGPAKLRNHGDTRGQLYTGAAYGSYNVYRYQDLFSTGPITSLEYQWTKVHGYSESGASIGNLQYQNQRNQSFAAGLGWQLNWSDKIGPTKVLSQYGINLTATINRQWLRTRRGIRFREKSISGPWGTWPFEMERSTYFSGTLNSYLEFYQKWIASLGYFVNAGSHNMSEHRITLSLTLPLGKGRPCDAECALKNPNTP